MNERIETIWMEISKKCFEEAVSDFYLEMIEIDVNWIWYYIYVNNKELESTIDIITSDDLRELCILNIIKLKDHSETFEQFKTERYYYQIINNN